MYSLLVFLIALPINLLFLFTKRGRVRWLERFGFWDIEKTNIEDVYEQKFIWLHGASSGEVVGLIPVVRELKKNFPKNKILVTSTSPTGIEFAKNHADVTRLVPFDSQIFLKKALSKLKISFFIKTESDWWVGLNQFLRDRKIDAYCINTIPPRTPFYKNLLKLKETFKLFFVNQEKFKEELMNLGIKEESIITSLNTKYEASPVEYSRKDILKDFDIQADFIVTLASIRPGEENILFPAIKEILSRYSKEIFFIIAPRHREKDKYFSNQLNKFNINFVKRSDNNLIQNPNSNIDALLLDTFGELEKAYFVSNLAFIGATLVNIGGHNPLEATMYKVPIVVGGFTHKIDESLFELKKQKILFKINSSDDFKKLLENIIISPLDFRLNGEASYLDWLKFQGSAKKIVNEIN